MYNVKCLLIIRQTISIMVLSAIDNQVMHVNVMRHPQDDHVMPTPKQRVSVACIREADLHHGFIEQAKEVADRIGASLRCLCVTEYTSLSLKKTNETHVQGCLVYGRHLGVDMITVGATSVKQALYEYAKNNCFTDVILTETLWPWHAKRVMRRLSNAGVRDHHAIARHSIRKTHETSCHATSWVATHLSWSNLMPFFYGLLFILLAIVMSSSMADALPMLFSLTTNILLLLFVIILIAYKWGTYPSLFVALISAAYVNYTYIYPTTGFGVASIADMLTLAVFVLVSISVGQLAYNLKQHIIISNARRQRTEALYHFTKNISGESQPDRLMQMMSQFISQSFGLRSMMVLSSKGKLALHHPYPRGVTVAKKAKEAMRWAVENDQACGRGTSVMSSIAWHVVPMHFQGKVLGVLGVHCENANTFFHSEHYHHFQNMLDQSANVLMRMLLANENEQNRVLAETERLRSALLSSVSHDLRTPLVTIKGTISELLHSAKHYDSVMQRALLNAAYAETERLTRYIQNLLQMTKMATKGQALHLLPSSLIDIINNALSSTQRLTAQHSLVVDVPVDLALIDVDPIMTEQVFINLITNAVKFSHVGSNITITAKEERDRIRVDVQDQGQGIEAKDLESIFDLFYRAQNTDKQSEGSGMGLAICKGILDSEQASITAFSEGKDRGATFQLLFTVSQQQFKDYSE